MPPAATTEVLATGAVWNGGIGCDNPPEPEVAIRASVSCARGGGGGIDNGEVEEFPEPELVRDEDAGPPGCAIEELAESEVAGAEPIV